MKGYTRVLLRVDLTTGKITKESIPEEYLKDYIGGSGLATRYLYDEIPSDADPLGPDNKICISVGPLNGGAYPTSGRFNLSCLSPLTGIWLDASSSGKLAYHLKKAGYDAIIMEGVSKEPVYLSIYNGEVELRDASKIWGMKIAPAMEAVFAQCGNNRASISMIGPAGEHLLPMANVMNNKRRTVGRGGAGAVMGSKKLKAIVVYGDRDFEVAEPEEWKAIIKESIKKLQAHPATGQGLPAYGTSVVLARQHESGDVPAKNWQIGDWDGYMKISGPAMAQTILVKHPNPCHACPIHCARHVEIKEGEYKMAGEGPEYETLASFGSMCLNDDLESIVAANVLCNEYGMDTISVGSAIAFAMEAYEKGIITAEDTEGIDLTWGNEKAILAMIEKIGNREGLGDVLGQGVRKAAQQLGKGAEEFSVHVKGMELPYHDPRAFFETGVTYATSPRGACHLHGHIGSWHAQPIPEGGLMAAIPPHETRGKGKMTKLVQDISTVVNSAVVCQFTNFALSVTHMGEALTAATGEPWDGKKVLEAGERIFNLQRAFNNRRGITSADDNLPGRVLASVKGGPVEGKIPDMGTMLNEYYIERGWETDGRPSRKKLQELGLDFVIGDLYQD
ncbi:MAG: aldehyde ferredoxin oxidoreductase family protein [Deltaproteobacteria bacterium]|nr:aldehyde ferredoxin oxidoreductase family protein [Deltaproteobacteria bacterium]